MSGPKGKARPKRARSEPEALLRQLQVAVAVAKCVAIAAERSDDKTLDLADAVTGIVLLLEPVTAMLDPLPAGAS